MSPFCWSRNDFRLKVLETSGNVSSVNRKLFQYLHRLVLFGIVCHSCKFFVDKILFQESRKFVVGVFFSLIKRRWGPFINRGIFEMIRITFSTCLTNITFYFLNWDVEMKTWYFYWGNLGVCESLGGVLHKMWCRAIREEKVCPFQELILESWVVDKGVYRDSTPG